MKKLLLFSVLLFSFSVAQSQTYTYKPLNLDTSSFWIHYYQNYTGINGYPEMNRGEILSFVEKDTMISNYKYHKIVGYVTKVQENDMPWMFTRASLYTNYLREDTSAKKVYLWNGSVDTLYVDFSANVGDTLNTLVYNNSNSSQPVLNWEVDSVVIKNYFGVNRRVLYWLHSPASPESNFTIEGVGMNFQFPFNIGGGEWGISGFVCKCYSAKDTVQYLWNQVNGVFPKDSCYKKTRIKQWAIGLENLNKTIDLSFSNNIIRIYNLGKGQLHIYNSIGVKIRSEKPLGDTYQANLSYLPKGIYIVKFESGEQRITKKILVQ